MIEVTQNSREWDNETTCGERMKRYFPITRDNAYGVIPLLGLAASCFAVGIIMTIFDNSVSDGWFGVWFSLGFLTFVGVQALWGFHVKTQRFLLLWMSCKIVEVLGAVAGLIYGLIGWKMCGLIAPSICLLILLVIMLHVGYSKYKNCEKPENNNIFADQCLDKIITK